MRIIRLCSVTALAFTAGLLSQARADQVPGKNGNCAATWDTGTATVTLGTGGKPAVLSCQDGDPSCDTDGVPDGLCTIVINACVGQITDTCPTPPPLTNPLKFSAAGSKKLVQGGFVPPGAPPSCGTPGTVVIPLKRVPKNVNKPLKKFNPSKKSTAIMKSKGGFLNKLSVQCVPPIGGTTCALRTDDPALPAQVTLTVPATGSDLDTGWTGSSHNFPVVNGSSIKYCLSNCDGTSDTLCDGSGTTGEGSLNGPTFGAPLPLLAANVPVCVVSRYQTSPITNTFDLASGQSRGDVNLFSDTYLTNNPTEVCPRCNPTGGTAIGQPGRCSATARTPNAACIIGGQVNVALGAGNRQYFLASECIPVQSQLAATLDIRLPLTTGQAPALTGEKPCGDSAGPQVQADSCGSGTCTEGACTGDACISGSGTSCIDAKGGISQACCSNNTATPCFLSRATGSITRSGTPATSGNTGASAATFCIARTQAAIINTVTGLPGPGAIILPTEVLVTPTQ
jgi:hypothetical protein